MENRACCCHEPDFISGCMVCGRDLYCTPDIPLRAKCYYCGKEEVTHTFCMEGHYVCNECHRKDILELVEQACMCSNSTDPLALALQIFSLPTLHMHGPEYHTIVPAVLVTAYGNSAAQKDSEAIQEAISRGKAVFGGICGTHGACGAAIGVGIAYSIIHRVTPYSREDRGEANRMTALALMAISRTGGPRCCKRDSVTAIKTAMEYMPFCKSIGDCRYVCSQFQRNELCIHGQCPYHPMNDVRHIHGQSIDREDTHEDRNSGR